MVELLVAHAEHEDEFVQPVIERFAPAYAAEIAEAHPRLECQMAELEVLADRAADACPEQARILTHRLYLGLASFTAEYLQHQEFEEFEVMVMLSQHLTFEELLAIDNAIVASIEPDMMAKSAALMLPAMNIEDQTDLFEGARNGVPPEVFQGMLMLARDGAGPGPLRRAAPGASASDRSLLGHQRGHGRAHALRVLRTVEAAIQHEHPVHLVAEDPPEEVEQHVVDLALQDDLEAAARVDASSLVPLRPPPVDLRVARRGLHRRCARASRGAPGCR